MNAIQTCERDTAFRDANYTYVKRAMIACFGHSYRLDPEWLKPLVRIWVEYHAEITGPYDDLDYHPTFVPPFMSILRTRNAS